MVVAMPPTSVAKPIGISTPEADLPVRRLTLTRIGNSSTTMGVLLTKALRVPPTTRVSNSEKAGLMRHIFASTRPTGSSAPVRTIPCPAIINAQTATSASWPNP